MRLPAWPSHSAGRRSSTAATGAERFVNISTDKAAESTSVLGYTKRITERLTAHTAQLGTRGGAAGHPGAKRTLR